LIEESPPQIVIPPPTADVDMIPPPTTGLIPPQTSGLIPPQAAYIIPPPTTGLVSVHDLSVLRAMSPRVCRIHLI